MRDPDSEDPPELIEAALIGAGLIAFEAGPDAAGQRLDQWLAQKLGADFSRSRVQALIKQGAVSVGGKAAPEARRKMAPGDVVTVDLPQPEPPEPQGEDIALDVLYEDSELIVLNKPAGLVVHPGAGNFSGTLVNALIHHCGDTLSGIGGVKRPGIVHRLDKDTSGVMVVAKTDRAHHALSEAFADHGLTGTLERAYVALVWGAPERKHWNHRRSAGPRPRIVSAARWCPPTGATRAAPSRATRCWSVMERNKTTPPPLPWSNAGSKPAAPTRSAFTWRISAIRSSAIRITARLSAPRPTACPSRCGP